MTTKTQEQIEAQRAYRHKYAATSKGKAARRKYEALPEVKEAARRRRATPEAKVAKREYDASPKARAAKQRRVATPKARARLKVRRAERREMALAYLGGVCVQCGGTNDLQFDHIVASTKSFTISSRILCAWPTQVSELDKCQPLCRQPCHAAKTKEERKNG